MADNSRNYKEINEKLEKGEVIPEGVILSANFNIIASELKNLKKSTSGFSDADWEVFESTGLEALIKAIRTYNYTQGPFYPWAKKIINQEVIKEMRRNGARNISFENEFYESGDDSYDSPEVQILLGELRQDNLILEDEIQNQLSEAARKITKLIKLKKKGISESEKAKQIDIFLDFMGLKTGKRATVNDLMVKTGRKRSVINKIIKSFNRILLEDYEFKEGIKGKMAGESIKPKDLLLLNYIIDKNNEFKFPTSEDIMNDSELSTQFGCRDTISKSIRRLKDVKGCHFELVGQKRGYKLLNVDQILKLTNEDLVTMSIISVLLKQYENTPLKKSFRAIWEKIMEGQSVVSTGQTFQYAPVSIITEPMPEIGGKIFNQLMEASRQHRTLNFVYDSPNSASTSERKVDPYHIVCQKGSWYLLAYDYSHETDTPFRWYAFSRIKECRVTKNTFEPKADFKISDHFDPKAGILWQTDPIKVKLYVNKLMARFISEREWFQDQKYYKKEDGSVIIEFVTNHPVELERFIMNYSPDVKVLEPESLRERIKELALKTTGLYEKNENLEQ